MTGGLAQYLMGSGQRAAKNGLADRLSNWQQQEKPQAQVTVPGALGQTQQQANPYGSMAEILMSRATTPIAGLAAMLLNYTGAQADKKNKLADSLFAKEQQQSVWDREDAREARQRGYAVEDRDAAHQNDVSKMFTQHQMGKDNMFDSHQNDLEKLRLGKFLDAGNQKALAELNAEAKLSPQEAARQALIVDLVKGGSMPAEQGIAAINDPSLALESKKNSSWKFPLFKNAAKTPFSVSAKPQENPDAVGGLNKKWGI